MTGEPTEPTGQQQETKQAEQAPTTQPTTEQSKITQQPIPDVSGLEPRQAMKKLAGEDEKEAGERKPVPEEWLAAELQGNSLWPQMNTGIMLFLGKSVVDTMSNGTTSWTEFQKLLLTDNQIDGMGKSLNGLHTKYNVPFRYDRNPAEGARNAITPDDLRELWRREQYGVAAFMFRFMELTSGSQEQITPPTFTDLSEGRAYSTTISNIPEEDLVKLDEFFKNLQNASKIELLKTVLESATNAMWERSGKEDAREYRETVAYKRRQEIQADPNLSKLREFIFRDLHRSILTGVQNGLTKSNVTTPPNFTEDIVNASFGAGRESRINNSEM